MVRRLIFALDVALLLDHERHAIVPVLELLLKRHCLDVRSRVFYHHPRRAALLVVRRRRKQLLRKVFRWLADTLVGNLHVRVNNQKTKQNIRK